MAQNNPMSETAGLASTVRDPDSALAVLEELASRGDRAGGQDPALHAFLRWIASAARAGSLPTGAERDAFVAASAPLLQRLFHALDKYVLAASKPFGSQWHGGEWVRACEERTRIELLHELYRGSAAEETLANAADPSDLDDGFKKRGELEGYLPADQIPPGTPPSHWWWWYPNSPPTA